MRIQQKNKVFQEHLLVVLQATGYHRLLLQVSNVEVFNHVKNSGGMLWSATSNKIKNKKNSLLHLIQNFNYHQHINYSVPVLIYMHIKSPGKDNEEVKKYLSLKKYPLKLKVLTVVLFWVSENRESSIFLELQHTNQEL